MDALHRRQVTVPKQHTKGGRQGPITHVEFVVKGNGPKRLVADAYVVFDSGCPLEGCKLVGFSIWKSSEGALYVTLPARTLTEKGFGYFDFLRAVDGKAATINRVKGWILEEFKKAKVSA